MTVTNATRRGTTIRGLAAMLAALVAWPVVGHTALQGRDLTGNGVADAYYDTGLDITWLANANLAASNTFGVGGINASGTMNWSTANDWIGAMNPANYLGYNSWRLPSALNQDGSGPCFSGGPGSPCTSSEMGFMFDGNGVTATSPGVFQNVEAGTTGRY